MGSTAHPDEAFMRQVGRTLTMADAETCRVLICDRDAKWSEPVHELLHDADPCLLQDLVNGLTRFCIAGANEDATALGVCHRRGASNLADGRLVWVRRSIPESARDGTRDGSQNTVYIVNRPRQVQTSVVKKSALAITSWWARRKVRHAVGRSGTGGSPWALRTRGIVDGPTRCARLFSAPWIRV